MEYLDKLRQSIFDSMQAAEGRGAANNTLDFLKGAGRAYTADIAGTPVDMRNMVSGALSPEGGGNPYAQAIRNLIGRPDDKYGSDYFADQLGIGGEGLAYNAGNMMGPEGVKSLFKNALSPAVLRQLTTYHGTPHRFPATERNPLGEFDLNKIGTGEGAQVFGHGIYVAENPDVANWYANNLTTHSVNLDGEKVPKFGYRKAGTLANPSPSGEDLALSFTNSSGSVPSPEELRGLYKSQVDVLNNARKTGINTGEWMPDFRLFGRAFGPNSGIWNAANWVEKNKNRISVEKNRNLYTIDTPDEHIDKMLDWNAPFSEQPKHIQEALKPFMDDYAPPFDATGGQIYEFIARKEREKRGGKGVSLSKNNKDNGKIAASQYLNSLGIPGIKYLDGVSRAANDNPTRNFVLFDPSIATIIDRKAKGGLASLKRRK
jgi:hypothetical protein